MTQEELKDTKSFVSRDEPVKRFFGPSPKRVEVRFGAVSDRGRVRPRNEDHYAVVKRNRSRAVLASNLPSNLLPETEEAAYVLTVADGIGGAAFGEVASMLALRTAWDLAERETCWTLNMDEEQAQGLSEKFAVYAQLIHQRLLDHVRGHPKTAGMGTTLTVAYTVGPVAFIGHIGDSRAYLYREGSVYHLTHDHTLAQELLSAGMAPEEAARFGHVLTNFLGGKSNQVATETHSLLLRDGDGLLLCTDGLTGELSDDQIARRIEKEDDPQKACQSLLEAALERGGRDNITIVLARYGIPPSPDEAPP